MQLRNTFKTKNFLLCFSSVYGYAIVFLLYHRAGQRAISPRQRQSGKRYIHPSDFPSRDDFPCSRPGSTLSFHCVFFLLQGEPGEKGESIIGPKVSLWDWN